MRLLTHNMLVCPRTKTFPLRLTISTCDDVDVEYSEEFVRRMVPRLDWSAFLTAAKQLPDPQMISMLPDAPPEESDSTDESIWRAIHRALLEWHVVEGELHAQDGTSYLVRNGVPNLVITEVRQPGADPMNVEKDDSSEQPDQDGHIENASE